jgi:hypothetical protein
MNAVVPQTGSDKTALRPFQVKVPEAELTERACERADTLPARSWRTDSKEVS